MTKPDSTTAASADANIGKSDDDVDRFQPAEVQREAADGRQTWSTKLAERFGMDFGDELNQWWDEICFLSPGPGEFRYPVLPEVLLATVPDPIWPPLMPPNFLPLVGNGTGDWLCVRLLDPDVAAQTGRLTDICHWYHGGGDWLPWGDRLSEALLFDWLLLFLPQSGSRHAEPAEAARSDAWKTAPVEGEAIATCLGWREHAWGRWVTERLPELSHFDWDAASDPRQLAAGLLTEGLCEVPVRCQLVIDALASALSTRLTPQSVHEADVTWNDWMRWCFDLRTIPADVSARLHATHGIAAHDFSSAQQDWNEVATHAAAVCQSHPDLSWGHDLLGYAMWSSGDSAGAMQAFSNAIRCSVFTDQSVRLRTHWATATERVAKFAARFLPQLAPRPNSDRPRNDVTPDQLGRLPAAIHCDRLLEYLGPQSREEGALVRQRYSQMLVDEATATSSPATSVRLLYAAGWDLGAEPMRRYGELLDRYIVACRVAGWAAHEHLASIHRDGLKARYNL